MHLISGKTVSNTILQAFEHTLSPAGEYVPSRNGGCTSIFDTTFEVQNPRSRHLSLIGRKSNIFALIAETFWVMAGLDEVRPYLNFFLPRAPDYSDNDKTWHGAYGPRMYMYNQFHDAINVFNTDGLRTRRSYVMIADPMLDNQLSIEHLYGAGHKAKDIPCNRELHFYVERNKFCAKTIQRSGDLIFGTGSINPFEFSFVQELMYNEVKKIHPDVELGAYRWHVTNAHLYDFSKSQAEEALKNGYQNSHNSYHDRNDMPLVTPDHTQWQAFFRELVDAYTDAITCEPEDVERIMGCLIPHLGHTFVSYGLPMEDNLMWEYAKAVAFYVGSKKGCATGILDVSQCDPEYQRAIVESSFRKFDIQYTI